jgi:hypothetical protein
MVHDIELNLRRLLLRCEQHVEDAERASTASPSGPPLHTVRGSLPQTQRFRTVLTSSPS